MIKDIRTTYRMETVYRWGLPYDAVRVKVLQVQRKVRGRWVWVDVG